MHACVLAYFKGAAAAEMEMLGVNECVCTHTLLLILGKAFTFLESSEKQERETMAFHEKGQITRVKYWNTPHRLSFATFKEVFISLDTKNISVFSSEYPIRG